MRGAKRQQKRGSYGQRNTLPLKDFVSQPCFSMDTSNKIRVVDRDTFRMTRTYPGGVRDPSGPSITRNWAALKVRWALLLQKGPCQLLEVSRRPYWYDMIIPSFGSARNSHPGHIYASPSSHPPICRGQVRGRPIRRMSVHSFRKQYRPTDLSRGTSRFRAALAGQEVLDCPLLVSRSAKSAVHQ